MENNKVNSTESQFLVVTDLDGTLLDHHTYSWAAAVPSIQGLQKNNIPIIINTSKTAEEVTQLQNELSLNEGFIVENGSALYLPLSYLDKYNFSETVLRELVSKEALSVELFDTYFLVVFGRKYPEIIQRIKNIKHTHDYQFEGYSDWNIEKIIEHTGLSQENAELSKKRAYSEPIIWNDTDEKKDLFLKQVYDNGLMHLQGGRFLHVLGKTNKARPMIFLKSLLERALNKTIHTIALGDSGNDMAMLEVADYPVWIKSPKGEKLSLKSSKKAYYTKNYGPEGWHEAITEIIQSTKN